MLTIKEAVDNQLITQSQEQQTQAVAVVAVLGLDRALIRQQVVQELLLFVI